MFFKQYFENEKKIYIPFILISRSVISLGVVCKCDGEKTERKISFHHMHITVRKGLIYSSQLGNENFVFI